MVFALVYGIGALFVIYAECAEMEERRKQRQLDDLINSLTNQNSDL